MNVNRRRFLFSATAGVAAAGAMPPGVALAHADEPSAANKTQDKPGEPVNVRDGDELQRVMNKQAEKGGGVVRLARDGNLTCLVRQMPVARETSIHALLVPEGVKLDLNGSTLLLDMRSNSYGVRLAARSAISGGRIKVVGSAGKGSQAIWHSAISVGAAYGDGGTVAQPGHFSTVADLAFPPRNEPVWLRESHPGAARKGFSLDETQ